MKCSGWNTERSRQQLTLPLIWSLYTQTIRCWGSGLYLAPGSTLILAYTWWKRWKNKSLRVTITEQFYPLIQAENKSSSPVTQGGDREMRALLTTLLFWGIMVSAPLVWKRTRLCQLYNRPLRHRKPGSRCDTTGRPWEGDRKNYVQENRSCAWSP